MISTIAARGPPNYGPPEQLTIPSKTNQPIDPHQE